MNTGKMGNYMYVKFKTDNSTTIIDISKIYIIKQNNTELLTLECIGSEDFWIPEIQDLEKWEKAITKVTRNFVTIYDIDQDKFLGI